MILPFRDTPLTRAVDPVKMYEYIALGKPILCARLPALAKFAPFATFYGDAARCLELVARRAITQPPGSKARAAFLADATWHQRAASIATQLHLLLDTSR